MRPYEDPNFVSSLAEEVRRWASLPVRERITDRLCDALLCCEETMAILDAERHDLDAIEPRIRSVFDDLKGIVGALAD